MANDLQELGEWKVGMEVVVNGPYNSRKISKISKITDGRGGTVLVDDKTYDARGFGRGGDVWTRYHIVPLTPELKMEVILEVRKSKLDNFHFNTLTPEQASEIVLFMRSKGIKI
jgi:hypothetical protein